MRQASLSLFICSVCSGLVDSRDSGHFKGGVPPKGGQMKTKQIKVILLISKLLGARSPSQLIANVSEIEMNVEIHYFYCSAPDLSWLPSLATELRRMAAAQERVASPSPALLLSHLLLSSLLTNVCLKTAQGRWKPALPDEHKWGFRRPLMMKEAFLFL